MFARCLGSCPTIGSDLLRIRREVVVILASTGIGQCDGASVRAIADSRDHRQRGLRRDAYQAGDFLFRVHRAEMLRRADHRLPVRIQIALERVVDCRTARGRSRLAAPTAPMPSRRHPGAAVCASKRRRHRGSSLVAWIRRDSPRADSIQPNGFRLEATLLEHFAPAHHTRKWAACAR